VLRRRTCQTVPFFGTVWQVRVIEVGQTRSMTVAEPMPPAAHMATTP
jgi:hypothetical protein